MAYFQASVALGPWPFWPEELLKALREQVFLGAVNEFTQTLIGSQQPAISLSARYSKVSLQVALLNVGFGCS
jgi:hypothetical protein